AGGEVPRRPARRAGLAGEATALGKRLDVALPSLVQGLADEAVDPAVPSATEPERADAPALPRPAGDIDVEALTEPPGVGLEQTARRTPEQTAPARGSPTRALREILRDRQDANSVVARVNGEELLWGDLVESAANLSEEYRDRVDTLVPSLLRRLVDMKLVAQAARGLGLHEEEAISRRVRAYEENLIRRELLRRLVEEVVDQETLEAAHGEIAGATAEAVKVKARHILVASEESARDVIAALEAGGDFTRLARERSMGSSARRGGDLGTFELNRMVPAFAAAVAVLEVGSYTKEPVRTEFGWHVILLEERIGSLPPDFAETAPRLRRTLARQAIESLVEELRRTAVIELPEITSVPGDAEPEVASDEEVLSRGRPREAED
ncbi:MAG: peptidylprolyl isomerase, partial [Kiloniellales bacterium]|nr:peptidylprolyl isomerase [Kiloniellales bacterium]